jgi:hypothetical protein
MTGEPPPLVLDELGPHGKEALAGDLEQRSTAWVLGKVGDGERNVVGVAIASALLTAQSAFQPAEHGLTGPVVCVPGQHVQQATLGVGLAAAVAEPLEEVRCGFAAATFGEGSQGDD